MKRRTKIKIALQQIIYKTEGIVRLQVEYM